MSKRVFYITGTSSGIGKALAEEILKEEDTVVFGYSRRSSVSHDRYFHFNADFADIENLKAFSFQDVGDATEIFLINNAGVIGEIKRIGQLNADRIIECYHVNLVAPTMLTNNFIKQFEKKGVPLTILNISSGAARFPIDAWSIYCSSKAGIDMFSRVLNEESKLLGRNLRVVSVAPGVVDTNMQDQIRSSSEADFSRKQDFVNYKEKGELLDPEKVAQGLCKKVLFAISPVETISALKDL